MKQSPKQLIAAVLLAGVGLAAVALTPAAPAPSGQGQSERMERHDPGRMQQFMQQRRAQKLARLKDTLQITPAQEGGWTTWTASMQPPANWKRPDRAELERLPTPERIDRMRALRTERIAMMDKRGEATKGFYASLDPVQKRVFDLETARLVKGHGGGGGEHHRHHGWGR